MKPSLIYKSLLRIQRQTFGQDLITLQAAQKWTRSQFERKSSEDQLEDRLKEAQVLGNLLKHNVIQAQLVSTHDQFRKESRPRYRLLFRPDLEINDGHYPKSKVPHKTCGC